MRSQTRARHSLPAVRRALPALALGVLAVCAGGCLTADGTLESDGSGTLKVEYKAPPGSTEAQQRAVLSAPGVTIESFTLGADQTVSAKLAVRDVAAISKIPLFKTVTVTRAPQGDDQVLTIAVKNPADREPPKDKDAAGPKIRLALPGKVVEASDKGTIDGTHVQWSFTLVDWLAPDSRALKVRYRPAPPGGEPKAATPPGDGGQQAPSAPARKAKPGAKAE